MSSIWSSVEVDAWSRGFDYQNYLSLHTNTKTTGNAISFDMYQSLGEILFIEMEDYFK